MIDDDSLDRLAQGILDPLSQYSFESVIVLRILLSLQLRAESVGSGRVLFHKFRSFRFSGRCSHDRNDLDWIDDRKERSVSVCVCVFSTKFRVFSMLQWDRLFVWVGVVQSLSLFALF